MPHMRLLTTLFSSENCLLHRSELLQALISDVSGAGNNWAHGNFGYGPKYRDQILDKVGTTCVRQCCLFRELEGLVGKVPTLLKVVLEDVPQRQSRQKAGRPADQPGLLAWHHSP